MDHSSGRNTVRLDSVNRISDRLLQGWTLLSDGCPDCGVPLLRKAPAPDMWCVNCEASYLGGQRIGEPRSNPDGSRQAMSGNGDPRPESPLAYHASDDVAPSSGSSDAGGDVAADDPTADPRLGPFARRSPAPAPMPAVQASGRSSRSSTGGPNPAAGHPAAGPTASVRRAPALDSPPLAVGLSLEPAAALAGAPAHHRPMNGLAPGEGTPDSDTDDTPQHGHGINGGLSNGGSHGGGAASRAEAVRRRGDSDRVSAALGRQMLQGWALLDAYCPMCNTPLVRSRDGRRFCVGCEMDVVQAGGGDSAGHGGAAIGAPAAASSQPRSAAAPTGTSTGGPAAAAADAEHTRTQLQMYEAAGTNDGRGLGAGDCQTAPSPATPESPAIPAPAAAAGAASGVSPQGGRPAAALPAGWLSRTHQQPAAIGMQGAQPLQLPQLPSWMVPSQQLGASASSQPQRQGPRQGSPKRGSGARSPPGSSSPPGDGRRKRERTGGSADPAAEGGLDPATASGTAGQPGGATARTATAAAAPHSAAPAQPVRLDSLEAGRPAADVAPEAAPPPGLGCHDAASAAAVVAAAAHNTLLTQMRQTERQLAATPRYDSEALSRWTVLLGQQADTLAALRRSM